MKIALLDEYLKIAPDCADWSGLPDDCELTVFNEPIGDEGRAACRWPVIVIRLFGVQCRA